MTENECLAAIASGRRADELLGLANPKIKRRWAKLCREMIALLDEVKESFPDAEYYTASGGFNLMLGPPHSRDHRLNGGTPQRQLLALHGLVSGRFVRIGDGDF